MEVPSEKNLRQREGSRTPSLEEGKIRKPQGQLGLSPFPVHDPSPLIGAELRRRRMLSRRREEQGMYSGQWRNRGLPSVSPAPGTIPMEAQHGGSSRKA